MPETLTEQRTLAWRIAGTGPDQSHWLMIFKQMGPGRMFIKALRPGERFKSRRWLSADSFEAYAVSAEADLCHEFSRKYLSAEQTWSFTLHFTLHFRVDDCERLGLSLAARDPLERLQDEAASLLGHTARRFAWEEMKAEAADFALRLREAESIDGLGESKTNFRRLQDVARSVGIELRHLDVHRSLSEADVAPAKVERTNTNLTAIAVSNQRYAVVLEDLDHEVRARKELHEVMLRTDVARSSQALQGLERLRAILDALAQGGIEAFGTVVGEIRSVAGIRDALDELQGVQQVLGALAAGEAPPPSIPGGAERGALSTSSPGVMQLAARRASPLESLVTGVFEHLRALDGNREDQRFLLAVSLHLLGEAGLGAAADEDFLSGVQDELEARLRLVRSALPAAALDFFASILDREGLRRRLA